MSEKIFSPIIFELSARNLQLNFLRTLLAMIGIVIGIVAIVAMGMTGAAFSESITGSLTGSSNSITVSPMNPTEFSDGTIVLGFSTKELRNLESAVKSVTDDYTLVPMYSTYAMVRPIGTEGTIQASIYGLKSSDIEEMVTIEEGSIPRGASGVLIGRQLADDYNLMVGSRLEIPQRGGDSISVRVVGIMENTGGMSFTFSTDSAIVGTDSWYETFHTTKGLYTSALVMVDNLDDLDPVISAIEDKMNGRSDRTTDDTVRIVDARQMVETMQESLGMISLFLMAVGGISLLVAAVSIFNVMLMSVNERIREIGILRSIGTTKLQIMQMFLYEAAIIGFIGSAIGSCLSIFGAAGILYLMMGSIDGLFAFSVLMYIPYGLCIGIIVCVLSGLYPAWMAANLSPVEALASD